MHVSNIHFRDLATSPEVVGALLDGLGSSSDELWPADRWPAMRFDRPLGEGADGGHGPIRYRVETYIPGKVVTFRFSAPKGFDGTHGFVVQESDEGTRLTHVLAMRTSGLASLSWPLVYRPLHDALIEDALERAATGTGEAPSDHSWSPRVRALRGLLRAAGKRRD